MEFGFRSSARRAAAVVVVSHDHQHEARHGDHAGVTADDRQRFPRQPHRGRAIVFPRRRPAVQQLLLVAPRGVGHRRRVTGIDRDRPFEKIERLGVGFRAKPVERHHRMQEQIIRRQALGALAARPLDLGLAQRRLDRADHACGHVVLKVENVLHVAIEPVGPDVGAVSRVDQLPGDADTLSRPAHAALQNVAHAEFVGDLAHVDRAPL